MPQQQVIEGIWDEVKLRDEEFKGKHVKLIVSDGPIAAAPEEQDPTIALLERWIAEAPTDPEVIREAEAALLEFKRNLNAPRKEAGARLLYPDAE
jgi:hypothetical protein